MPGAAAKAAWVCPGSPLSRTASPGRRSVARAGFFAGDSCAGAATLRASRSPLHALAAEPAAMISGQRAMLAPNTLLWAKRRSACERNLRGTFRRILTQTWLTIDEAARAVSSARAAARSNKRNGETHQRDAADQQAAAPMLKHVAMGGKNVRDRGSQAADAKTGPTEDQKPMNHCRPR